MVTSRKFLLLSLICSGQAVFGNYIPRSLGEVSSFYSVTSSSSSSGSFHHSLKAQPSSSPSHYVSPAGTEQALTLNLTEPAIMQVVNHGSNNTKIVIFDYDIQVGETSLDSVSLNISLGASHKLNMELLSLDAGEHILYLIPRYNNGSHVSSSHINADVRLLPKTESRIIKRWNSNEGGNTNTTEAPFNAIVEWTIDPEEDEKEDYKQKKKLDNGDDDDEDDDDEDDDDEEDDNEEDDNDGDDNDGDDEEEEDEEESWKWDNNSGWKSQPKKKKYRKHNKIVKVFVPVSDCPVPSSSSTLSPTPSSSSSSSTPIVSSSEPVNSISSTSISSSSSSSTLPSTSERTYSSSLVPEPSTTPNPLDSSSTPEPTPTPLPSSSVYPITSSTPSSSSSVPSSSTSEGIPEPTTENVIIRTETIQGNEVTVIEGRNITVTNAKEVTVLVGRATTTTERETVIANTITFAIETITQPGQTLTAAGATETVAGATVTVAGPPVTYVALTQTVQGPGKTLTKFILQQTTKTTVLTQINDYVTVTQTQINPIYETVYGTTSTRTENVVVTVVRPTTTTTDT